jgi:membrane-associated phospholipid phosphatase
VVVHPSEDAVSMTTPPRSPRPASASPSAEQAVPPVREALEAQLARVASPAEAEAVLDQAERFAGDATEEERAQQTSQVPVAASTHVVKAARGPAPTAEASAGRAAPAASEEAPQVAQALVTAAAEGAGDKPDADAVGEAAQQALGQAAPAPVHPPGTERGRALLRAALLRRLGPLGGLDARGFIALNGVPHPAWLDATGHAIAVLTKGGGLWVAAVLGASLLGVPRSRRALLELAPSVAVTTAIVEYPVKHLVRRRRPFIDIVRALVVGQRPKSYSFPSGHTAASFATARVLSTVWPAAAPTFYGVAAVVGLSRIYVGDHYPGDVLLGALAGLVLSEASRRTVLRLTSQTRG